MYEKIEDDVVYRSHALSHLSWSWSGSTDSGSTLGLDIRVKNKGIQPVRVVLSLQTASAHITLIQKQIHYGEIPPEFYKSATTEASLGPLPMYPRSPQSFSLSISHSAPVGTTVFLTITYRYPLEDIQTQKVISFPVKNRGIASKIAASYSHSLILRSDGTLWTMGRNDNGQLGYGTTTDRSTPIEIR